MTPFEQQVLSIQAAGYAVLPGVLTPAECDEACAALERILAEESDPNATSLGPADGWAYDLMNKAPIFERTYQSTELRTQSCARK